jgi:chemotaxis protein MotB
MAKKKHHEEHENLERWLVSYADFITLLFAFFTILYALGQTDKDKYKNAVESIQKSFTTAGSIFPLKGNPLSPFDKPADLGSKVPPSPQDAGKFSKDEQETLERIASQVRGIFERATGVSSSTEDVEVIRTPLGFKVRLGEAMLFAPRSAKLKREQVPFLVELGKRLTALNLPIQVEGHSDSGEFTQKQDGNDKEAWDLSTQRAYNIVRFLIDGTGFPKSKISMGVFGNSIPLATEDSPEAQAKNRRVEISVATPDREIPYINW